MTEGQRDSNNTCPTYIFQSSVAFIMSIIRKKGKQIIPEITLGQLHPKKGKVLYSKVSQLLGR